MAGTYMHMLMRDEEGRKKEASMVKQSKGAQNTQGSHFPKKNELGGGGGGGGGFQTHNELHSRQSALPAEWLKQLIWLAPNLTYIS